MRLNSGAVVSGRLRGLRMPNWAEQRRRHINVRDAVKPRGHWNTTALRANTVQAERFESATLLVRPRGWHLNEKHVFCWRPSRFQVRVSLFGLFFFHTFGPTN